MEINPDDLTEEQRNKIIRLYLKYKLKNVGAVISYIGFAFFANYIAFLVNEFYLHNETFRSFLFIGNTVIAIGGLRGTLEEQSDAFVLEVEKVAEQS